MKKILELTLYIIFIIVPIFAIRFTLAGEIERQQYGDKNEILVIGYWLITFQIPFMSIIFCFGILGLLFFLFRMIKS